MGSNNNQGPGNNANNGENGKSNGAGGSGSGDNGRNNRKEDDPSKKPVVVIHNGPRYSEGCRYRLESNGFWK